MAHGSFATAINCMDGRVQYPVNDWMKARFGVDYVDVVSEAGPDGLFFHRSLPHIEAMKQRVMISVNGHGSRNVAIVAHHECAGNPADKETHLEHLRHSMEIMASWGLPVQLLSLWVDEDWVVHLVDSVACDAG